MAARGVAIVGGGPAGCSAALHCSQLGIPVVLFESRDRYREKPCGDALVASAVALIQRFGLGQEELFSLGGRPFNEIRFGRVESAGAHRSSPHPGGWVVPRAALDQALRDVVSRTCEVRYSSAVAELFPNGSGVSVKVSQSDGMGEHFRAAIIASGAASRLSKSLGIDGAPTQGVAFRGYVEGVQHRNSLLVELTSNPTMEYRWEFPIDASANVGACLLGFSIGESKGTAVAGLKSLVAGFGITKFSGGVEPLWSGNGRRWHHASGIVSCGDCAGIVDPITGEGITAALMSGEMAAFAVASYMENRDIITLERFSMRIGETFSAKYTAQKDIVSSMLASLE